MPEQKFVLIIEDANEIAEIFAEILQGDGMITEIVTDGALALQAMAERIPALILLDMHLPNVSGLQILTYVRSNPRLAKTKVIAVTADALIASSLEAQADLVLIKPVTYSQISDLSKRVLLLGTPADEK
jgi:CheY-like chemotaxis protein